MFPSLLMMPLMVLVLWLLPFKLNTRQLFQLAFCLWITGGLVLCLTGVLCLQTVATTMDSNLLLLGIVLSLGIGFGKGKFVLSKTSKRNIERIAAFSEPQRPINVYSLRSWLTIGLMILISLSLTWFDVSMEWRGFVRLAVGFALIMSSLAYLRAPKTVAAL